MIEHQAYTESREQMNFIKAKILILELGLICLCITISAPVAETAVTAEIPIFEPGREYHVITDNEFVASKSFNLYIPLD